MKTAWQHALPLILLLVFTAGAKGQAEGIQMDVLLRSSQTWNGADLPPYPRGKPEITIVKLTVPPGEELPVHLHPVINGGALLSGVLTVRTEAGQETRLRAGEALLEVVDTWHAGRNEGTEPAVALVFYVGTPDAELTVLKSPPPERESSGQ